MIMMMTMMMEKRCKMKTEMMKKMQMNMMTRAEKDGVREGGRERIEERKKRGETERQNTDMDPKHLRPCANHFQDHKRLLVPRSKQALSRRLQVLHPQKKPCSTVRLFGPCFKTGRTRPEKNACK